MLHRGFGTCGREISMLERKSSSSCAVSASIEVMDRKKGHTCRRRENGKHDLNDAFPSMPSIND
jgi:hypothetical protein